MTNEQALLAAIAANPDDDTVRLVYADLLDEKGGESNVARAEFIRLEIRYPRLHEQSRERADIRRRLDQLLWQWDCVWIREMPEGFRNLSGYRRGFPYRARATASAVAAAAEDSRTFLIEALDLFVDVSPLKLRHAVRAPLFRQIAKLHVKSDIPIGYGGARVLADGEFPCLAQLKLAGQQIGDIGLKALSRSRGFPQLRLLDLRNNNITDEGGFALLEAPFLPKIKDLILLDNHLSDPARDQVLACARGL